MEPQKEVNQDYSVKQQNKWQMPDTYVILFFVLLLGFLATYVLPSGLFERETIDGVERVIPNTYHGTDTAPLGFFDFFYAIQMGMVESADIIFLVLFTGGMFEIIERSGALNGAIHRAVHITRGNEFWLIAIVSAIFALTGAVGAVANAVIAFVMVGVIIARTLKLDPIVAVAITFGANFAGFSVGFINPYTVGIAQDIAGLPLFSGMVLRIIVFLVILASLIWYTWRYTKKLLKDPSKSFAGAYGDDEDGNEQELNAPFTTRHKLLLIFVGLSLLFFVYGSIQLKWTINHMSAFFVFIAIGAGIIAGMHYNKLAETFLSGTRKLVYGAMVVGLARSVIVVLENGQILDTIVYGIALPLEHFPPAVAAIGMFISNGGLNFLVNSGSGQAMIAMPMLAPLADMVGVTRQVAVQAYQFGDGLTNLIFPTSGILMASLAVANLSWTKWLKWIMPLFFIWLAIAVITLVTGVLINWGPF
ncbi:YfcC family protein [Virgibacillus halodenitrificans]|uniref:YfcC family protein n=1 Tax=Virgibacillus halodenitrificans TaxID=1482 RepID=UPI001F262E48|nr:YfcC family protein [Virgibacillus halodenitrificans]MCG1029150.1 YfcC family protein [Virgibacillus halodenitrificans]